MRKTVLLITAGCTAALLAGCASAPGSVPSGPAAAGAGPAGGSASASASASSAPATTPSPSATAATTAASPAHAATTAHAPATHPGTVPTSFGYSATANASALIDAARQAAAADHREVLLDFGADWCGNCVAMDHDFKTSQVQAVLAASYHLVQIDVDHDGGTLMHYDGSGSYALPVIIVLSPSGSIRVDTNKTGNPSFGQSGFLAFLKRWAG